MHNIKVLREKNGFSQQQVAEVVILRAGARVEVGQRYRGVYHCVLQSLVSVESSSGVVCAAAVYVSVGVARLEVEGGVLRGLRVQLEAEVVALVARTYLYGLVVHVGVAERVAYRLRAARDVDVVVERMARASVNYVLPVVGWNVLVEVEVIVCAEELGVRTDVVLVFEQSQLVLPLGVVVGRATFFQL